MDPLAFALNPADYGLPTREELVAYRIWDTHFHGFNDRTDPLGQFHANNLYVRRMGIERSVTLEAGGTLRAPLQPAAHDAELRELLVQERAWLSGITPIDPGFPGESCAKMEAWIRRGPCIGIKYVGGNSRGIP